MVICSMMDLNSAMAIMRDMLIWKSCIYDTVLTPTSRSICAWESYNQSFSSGFVPFDAKYIVLRCDLWCVCVWGGVSKEEEKGICGCLEDSIIFLMALKSLVVAGFCWDLHAVMFLHKMSILEFEWIICLWPFMSCTSFYMMNNCIHYLSPPPPKK